MRILLTLLLLLIATPCYAWMNVNITGGNAEVAAGGPDLFDETFDGTGTDNAACGTVPCWNLNGSAITDEDYATGSAPLVGTHSLRLDSSSSILSSYADFGATAGDVYAFYVVKFDTLASSSGTRTFSLFEVFSGGANIAVLSFNTSEQLTLLVGGSSNGPYSTAFNTTTNYCFWLYYDSVTGGSNFYHATMSGNATSGSCTKPGSPTLTVGSSSMAGTQAGSLKWLTVSGEVDVVVDHVQISTTPIGDVSW